MMRTPPRPGPEEPENRAQGATFNPPAARLGAVTKKGNQIKELLNAQCKDGNRIKELLIEHIEKVENVMQACNEQELDEDDNRARSDWLQSNDSLFVTFQLHVEKYLRTLVADSQIHGADVNSLESGSNQSVSTSRSLSRVRLAERKAKLKAEKRFNSNMQELEKE